MAAPAQRQATLTEFRLYENPGWIGQQSLEALAIPAKDRVTEDCAICLDGACEISSENRRLYSVSGSGEESERIRNIFYTNCQHYFHVTCFTNWEGHADRAHRQFTCPNCRQGLGGGDLQLISGRSFNATRRLWASLEALRINPDGVDGQQIQEAMIADLEQGALQDVKGLGGLAPIHRAVQQCYHRLIRYLLDHNANVNALDNDGNTPLHMATAKGCVSCVSELSTAPEGVDLQIKPFIENRHGERPIDLAEENTPTYQRLKRLERRMGYTTPRHDQERDSFCRLWLWLFP